MVDSDQSMIITRLPSVLRIDSFYVTMFCCNIEGQVAKLERHLSLLRQEYVKLQNKLIDLEQKYSLAVAASGQTGEHENTFVSKLLKTVAELFDKDLYR